MEKPSTCGVPIHHDSQEYLAVEHKLSCHLGTTLLASLEIKDISNINCIQSFRSRTEGILKIDSWIDVDKELSNANDIEHLYKRGFTFPADQSGMNFSSGGDLITKMKKNKDTTKTLLLCSVGVGRSHVVDSPLEIDTAHPVPPDCDSVFCGALPSVEDSAQHNTSLTYTMYDAHQVLPLYVVEFTIENEWNNSYRTRAQSQMTSNPSETKTKHMTDMNTNINMLNKSLNILENTNEPENEIYDMTKATLLSLQDEVQHKMSQVIAAEFELRRQMCEVQNAVRYYKHQRNHGCESPRNFHQLLKNPGNHIKKLFTSYEKANPKAYSIHPDIDISGKVNVINLNEDQRLTAGAAGPRGAGGVSPIKARVIERNRRKELEEGDTQRMNSADIAKQKIMKSKNRRSSIKSNAAISNLPKFKRASMSETIQARSKNKYATILPMKIDWDSKLVFTKEVKENIVLAIPNLATATIQKCFEWLNSPGRAPCVSDLISSLRDATESLLIFETSDHHRFGAYADSCLTPKSTTSEEALSNYLNGTTDNDKDVVGFGGKSCFLFSITHDTILPYHGRSRAKRIAFEKRAHHSSTAKVPKDALYVNVKHQLLKFGDTDLVIDYDLNTCRSKIESSYGIGLPSSNNESDKVKETYLAGSERFQIKYCEIYSIDRTMQGRNVDVIVFDGTSEVPVMSEKVLARRLLNPATDPEEEEELDSPMTEPGTPPAPPSLPQSTNVDANVSDPKEDWRNAHGNSPKRRGTIDMLNNEATVPKRKGTILDAELAETASIEPLNLPPPPGVDLSNEPSIMSNSTTPGTDATSVNDEDEYTPPPPAPMVEEEHPRKRLSIKERQEQPPPEPPSIEEEEKASEEELRKAFYTQISPPPAPPSMPEAENATEEEQPPAPPSMPEAENATEEEQPPAPPSMPEEENATEEELPPAPPSIEESIDDVDEIIGGTEPPSESSMSPPPLQPLESPEDQMSEEERVAKENEEEKADIHEMGGRELVEALKLLSNDKAFHKLIVRKRKNEEQEWLESALSAIRIVQRRVQTLLHNNTTGPTQSHNPKRKDFQLGDNPVGYLLKKASGAFSKGKFKKLHFRYDNGVLSYFADQNATKAKGNIDMDQVTSVKVERAKERIVFHLLMGKKTITLAAETDELVAQWVAKLKKLSNSVETKTDSPPPKKTEKSHPSKDRAYSGDVSKLAPPPPQPQEPPEEDMLPPPEPPSESSMSPAPEDEMSKKTHPSKNRAYSSGDVGGLPPPPDPSSESSTSPPPPQPEDEISDEISDETQPPPPEPPSESSTSPPPPQPLEPPEDDIPPPPEPPSESSPPKPSHIPDRFVYQNGKWREPETPEDEMSYLFSNPAD